MVPLVGFRQRHHERSGQPLGRPAVLGARAESAADDRSARAAAASGNRAGIDAGHLSIRAARRSRRHSSSPGIKASNKPAIWRDGGIPQWDSGVLFVGDKGMLLSDYGKHLLLPEDTFQGFEPPKPFIPKSLGHHAEWLHACKTGEPTTCNFEYAGWLTEANHLGNVAFRTGQRLEWDAANMRATNCSGRRSLPASRLSPGLEIVLRFTTNPRE